MQGDTSSIFDTDFPHGMVLHMPIAVKCGHDRLASTLVDSHGVLRRLASTLHMQGRELMDCASFCKARTCTALFAKGDVGLAATIEQGRRYRR